MNVNEKGKLMPDNNFQEIMNLFTQVLDGQKEIKDDINELKRSVNDHRNDITKIQERQHSLERELTAFEGREIDAGKEHSCKINDLDSRVSEEIKRIYDKVDEKLQNNEDETEKRIAVTDTNCSEKVKDLRKNVYWIIGILVTILLAAFGLLLKTGG